MKDINNVIKALEDADATDGVIKISNQFRDILVDLLKEQEAKYPVCEKCGKEIDHIGTSVFHCNGSDYDYSIPIMYSKRNGCALFHTSQKWTGYSLTDEERKEKICCPYCGKFPFDDSQEIQIYEPVEVLMWTSESRYGFDESM